MAQIFKSKELMFSLPEKEPGAQPNCVTASQNYSTPACHTICICTYNTPCAFNTFHNCTCTGHTHICYFNTIPFCTVTRPPLDILPPIEQEISQITDAETLKALSDKLHKSLEEVKARQAELSKSK